MSVGCDEGSFSFPEELQLVALLQAILKQSYILATMAHNYQYFLASTAVLKAKYSSTDSQVLEY